MLTYQRCYMVPEVKTRQIPYTTCHMVRQDHCRMLTYQRCYMVPEVKTRRFLTPPATWFARTTAAC